MLNTPTGSANFVQMGGRNFAIGGGAGFAYAAAGDVVYLCGNMNGGTFCGLGSPTTTPSNAAFQVPVGRSLRILALRITNGAAADQSGKLVYGDTSVDLQTGGAAPTNVVYQSGSGAVGWHRVQTGVGNQKEYLTNFVVPAGKYPAWGSNASTTVFAEVIGVLE